MSTSVTCLKISDPKNIAKPSNKNSIAITPSVCSFVESSDVVSLSNKFNYEDLIWEPLDNVEDCENLYKQLYEFVCSKQNALTINDINISKLDSLDKLLDYLKNLKIKNNGTDIPIITDGKTTYVSLSFQDGPYCIGNSRPMLSFHNPKYSVEKISFGFDRNGDLMVDRPFDTFTFWDNGNLKKFYGYGDNEYASNTFYNKDGSKAFWKNLLFKFFD